jgi:hypothetical protein
MKTRTAPMIAATIISAIPEKGIETPARSICSICAAIAAVPMMRLSGRVMTR